MEKKILRKCGLEGKGEVVAAVQGQRSRDIDGGDMPASRVVAGKTGMAARWSGEYFRSGMVQPVNVCREKTVVFYV